MLDTGVSPLEIEEPELSQEKPWSYGCCRLKQCLFGVVNEVRSLPNSTLHFYKRLCDQYSWRFVAMVSLVYGINQGLGEGWFMFAGQYYLSDPLPKGLALQPDQMQSVSAFANIPWQVKSVYGIFSDTFPIYGFHRTPYIIIAAVCGTAAWLGLALVPPGLVIGATLLVLGNLSVASPDVMIDAAVAERCKKLPQYTVDLQTLCWVSLGFGSVLSSITAGWLYDFIGSKGIYFMTSFTAISILYPAVMGWLKEQPKEEDVITSSPWMAFKQALADGTKGPIYKLSMLVLFVSISMGSVANWFNDDFIILIAAVVTSCTICLLIYTYEKQVSVRLAKASMYLYLSGAVQPNSQLVFYWSRENEENCSGKYGSRPCFSPPFLSLLSTLSYVAFIFGTAAYNKYLSHWSYKKIWTSSQVLLCLAGLLDYILVKRWNQSIGLSDAAFVIGDELVGDVVRRFNLMPLFALAAAICPDGVEATLFAMNMGLSNFGVTMGGYMGNGLMWSLGGISSPEYNNLDSFIILRSLARLLPILLVPLLVPEGSPATEGSEGYSTAPKEEPKMDDATPLIVK